MGGVVVSRLLIVGAGLLYPAYCSYKAVKTADIRQYVRWIMYWVVFALFTAIETFSDFFVSWIPFYYEAKILFVFWLVTPYTKGSSTIYKKFIHPNLSKREEDIDLFLENAKERGYQTVVSVGSRGINLAANVVATAAVKGQAVVSDKLKSYSVMDLTSIPENAAVHQQQPLSFGNPALVRERHQQSSVPGTQVDGLYPALPNQYKAFSMMNLSGQYNDLDQPLDGVAIDEDENPEFFSTEPPEYTIDDMEIKRRNNYAQEAVPKPDDMTSQYYTMPRPKKHGKTKQMPPMPQTDESVRRSKRKTKSRQDPINP